MNTITNYKSISIGSFQDHVKKLREKIATKLLSHYRSPQPSSFFSPEDLVLSLPPPEDMPLMTLKTTETRSPRNMN